MPKPSFPPTPTASLDITGKSSAKAPQLENGFALPPAALGSSRGSVASSSGPSENASDSSYRPLSPASPVASSKPGHARKRSSTAAQQSSVITKDDYSLPPPPTRSRKIIQMKPKDAQETSKSQAQSKAPASAPAGAANGTKKKQPGNASAAGRKIARKTAHSLIERRRRSKMNEEFGVLKDMIPACRGQEMHKLAILQASIEYMRYLEQCVADLKTAHDSRHDSPSSALSEARPPPPLRACEDDDDEEEEDEDEEMEDATYVESAVPPKATYQFTNNTPSPAIYPSDRSVHSYSTTTSPAILPHDRGHYSASTQSSDPHRYSLASIRSAVTSPSIHPSPAFSAHTPSATHFINPFQSGPASTGPIAAPGSSHSAAAFALTSPMLAPQADREDHEATEALLMLNTDRRSWTGARGMSVKDLLSG
ncbi:hypothetical protein DE146DRAFT_601736 [Phaeosphaeria sp. MPI-PUGE-AT-0046c]|nr:hypothetical protein DE146DRAFT_601736 [Phaeosphaeria sp. MPI-PUGE-AT-0046c]